MVLSQVTGNLSKGVTVFLRIEVALEYRPPPIRSRTKPQRIILKVIDKRISSNIGGEIATEKTYKPRPVFEKIGYVVGFRIK